MSHSPEETKPSPRKGKKGRRAIRKKRTWLLGHLLWLVALVWVAPLVSQRFMPAAYITLAPPTFLLFVSAIFLVVAISHGGRWFLVHLAAGALSIPFLSGWIAPWHVGGKSGEKMLRVASFNAAGDKADLDATADWIKREKIDVVCLAEVNGTRNIAIDLRKRLPDWHVSTRREVAVISRYPIGEEESIGLDKPLRRDVLGVRIQSPQPMWVVAVHWPAPVMHKGLSRLAFDQQDRRKYYNATLKLAKSRDLPTVIAGDFNTPPRHGLYLDMAGQYGNAFAQAGSGVGYTYSSSQPVIRIDHIWLSQDLWARNCEVGPHLGSDHRPLVTDVLKPKSVD